MSITGKTLITDAERARRAAAVHSARASFALEGFKPSAADLLHEQRFIDGEIDLAEYVNARVELANEQ